MKFRKIIILMIFVLVSIYVLADNETKSTDINDSEINITINETINETDNITKSNFSIIVIPDTENKFSGITEWIINNTNDLNLRFVLHTGDIGVDYQSTIESFDILEEAYIPYIFAYGNNDYGFGYEDYYTKEKFENKSWFGGYINERNYYNYFNVSNETYIILSLEFFLNDSTIESARDILENNSDKKAIVLSHSYLYESTKTSEGDFLWDNLINNTSNVIMVFCGHKAGESRLVNQTSYGNNVYQIRTDYEMPYRFKLYTFIGNQVEVKTFDLNDNLFFGKYSFYLNDSSGFDNFKVIVPDSGSGSGGGGGGCSSRKKVIKEEPKPCNKIKWTCELWQIYPDRWTRDCMNECNQTRYEYKMIEKKEEINSIVIEEDIIEETILQNPIVEVKNVGFFKYIINFWRNLF